MRISAISNFSSAKFTLLSFEIFYHRQQIVFLFVSVGAQDVMRPTGELRITPPRRRDFAFAVVFLESSFILRLTTQKTTNKSLVCKTPNVSLTSNVNNM